MNNPLIRKISATVVAVLLLVYVGYQIYLANYSGISTETALYSTVSNTIDTTGFVIRNEKVVDDSYSGVLNYTLDDGEKISSGGVIADVFASEESAAAANRLVRVDSEITRLSALRNPGEYTSANPQMIGSQITSQISAVLAELRGGSFGALASQKSDLQLLLSQKQIITGAETNDEYTARLLELNDERAALVQNAQAKTGSIVSPASGYFIRQTDGLENAVEPDEITNLSASDVEALLKKKPAASDVIGKVALEHSWYIACVLTQDELVQLDRTTSVEVEMPFVSLDAIPAEVVQINRDGETGDAAVILKCTNMSAALASARLEALSIHINRHSGVLVREDAIHFNDVTVSETDANGMEHDVTYKNVKGVYVKTGSRIKFVQVFSDATINGDAICKLDLSAEEREQLVTGQTIQLYDEVVVEGKDLHDGKML